jgi:hypothetical protein
MFLKTFGSLTTFADLAKNETGEQSMIKEKQKAFSKDIHHQIPSKSLTIMQNFV